MPELDDLTPEIRARIGAPLVPVPHEVTTLGIRTYARAVGYTNPVYYDADAARAKGHRDLLSPPGYYGMAIYDPGAVPLILDDFAPEYSRRLNGGTEIEPREPVYAGDVLDAVTRITDIQLRSTRLGQMLVRTSETVYTRQSDGVVVGLMRNTNLRY